MNMVGKVFLMVGGIFLFVGLILFTAFIFAFGFPIALFPMLFVLLGAVFCAIPVVSAIREKKAWREGKPYTGKVYGFVENTSVVVNGSYPINTVVRFFDERHMVREAILHTDFSRGSQKFAVGSTIDIREYKGRFVYNRASVRYETLKDEEILMENRSLDAAGITYVAVTCESCGASFKAQKGITAKCPYCDSYVKA